MIRIALVYTERMSLSLDRPFSYFVKDNMNIQKGTRVNINFNGTNIVGYVEDVIESNLSRKEYEEENGFELKDIESVIDNEPLLNKELQSLAHFMSSFCIASLISCYQTLLPPSLKPTSSKKTPVYKEKYVRFIKEDGNKLTVKDLELINILKIQERSLKTLSNFSSNITRLSLRNVIEKFDKEVYRDPLKNTSFEHKDDYVLTKDQQQVFDEINETNDRFYLLEGVTGSGKTEIYIRLAKQTLEQGKNVLILVPEISLTPQMIQRFKERFDCGIAIFHSKLSNGEKYDEYRRISRGEVNIVIGARSACFAPLTNIGLIIVDEEHSDSYKQDSTPAYHMIDLVSERARYNNSKVILGSATPSIESKTKALKGIYHQLFLDKRINNIRLPDVEIVDMMDEVKHGNYSLFSRLLKTKIQETLDNNKQVILLLNRRGYSVNIQCVKCGYVYKCDNCNIPLHYHKSDNTLKCHYCGKTIQKEDRCVKCGSKYLRYLGVGSQKLEEEVINTFKNARVLRLDLDTTSKKNQLEKSLKEFEEGKYNILLGTQIIAKGLDYPNIELVGVINADSELYFSDFRANEKAYQLFTQVVGRCGRGDKRGLAIIQTHSPKSKVLFEASQQDYASFYKDEMAYRKAMLYPPYRYLASITITATKKDKAFEQALFIKNSIIKNNTNEDLTLLGPSEPVLANEVNNYKYRIVIKYKDKENTIGLLNTIKDIAIKNAISVKFDTNPYQNI